MDTKKRFDAWLALLNVGWLAVLLGLTMEAILVALAAGFGTLHGTKPILADLVQKVSWSVVVCVGLAVGAMAKKARGPAMGFAGLLAAPLGFMVARSLHKGAMEALGLSASAGPGLALVLIAVVKGIQYGSFGLTLDWVGKKPWGGLAAHLLTGLAVGVVFGGALLALQVQAAAHWPPLPVLISRAANEFLFPVGCAFVIYVSKVMRIALSTPG
ncbi:MAG TPA: hypothetical protein VGJ57_08080 [Nitrospirales bacterium]